LPSSLIVCMAASAYLDIEWQVWKYLCV